MQNRKAKGQGNIPHPFGAYMEGIAIVAHESVPVINLKETVPAHVHQVLGSNGPIKIRMVNMRKHFSSKLLPLFQDRVDVVLDNVEDIAPARRGDQPVEIDGIEVDGNFFVSGADFFTQHQEETITLFIETTEFVQGSQADHLRGLEPPPLDPARAEAIEVFVVG